MANNNNENNVLLELSSPPPSPWDHLVRTLSEGFCGDRSAKQVTKPKFTPADVPVVKAAPVTREIPVVQATPMIEKEEEPKEEIRQKENIQHEPPATRSFEMNDRAIKSESVMSGRDIAMVVMLAYLTWKYVVDVEEVMLRLKHWVS